MIEGKVPRQCDVCFTREKNKNVSLRQILLSYYEVPKSLLLSSSLKEIISVDLHLGNLCHCSCRTCGPKYSSSHENSQIIPFAKNHLEFILKQLPHLKRLYFAGGEPLLVSEHNKILKNLILHKSFNTVLDYNTSLSIPTLPPEWKYFTNIFLSISIDGIAKRNEYIRKGSNYETILKNLCFIKEQFPHIKLNLSPTISTLNVWHLPELIQKLALEMNFFMPSDPTHLNILQIPKHYSICNLPEGAKKQVIKKLNHFIKKIFIQNPLSGDHLISELLAVISFIKQERNEMEWNGKNL